MHMYHGTCMKVAVCLSLPYDACIDVELEVQVNPQTTRYFPVAIWGDSGYYDRSSTVEVLQLYEIWPSTSMVRLSLAFVSRYRVRAEAQENEKPREESVMIVCSYHITAVGRQL